MCGPNSIKRETTKRVKIHIMQYKIYVKVTRMIWKLTRASPLFTLIKKKCNYKFRNWSVWLLNVFIRIFTLAFLLILATAGGSNPAGQLYTLT